MTVKPRKTKQTREVLAEAAALWKTHDENTAAVALATARDTLAKAEERAEKAMSTLRNLIVDVRPTGVLSVEEMAQAVGHDRNYVDSVWSNYGTTRKGRQTRAANTPEATEAQRGKTWDFLATASSAQADAVSKVKSARAERDRTVAIVYASKLLGPTEIARHVGVDRNHVLRLARRHGVGPAHRAGARNQYTASQDTAAK